MSASTVVTRLFASLRAAGCEATAAELADILWLAQYVPAGRASQRQAPGDASGAAALGTTIDVSSESIDRKETSAHQETAAASGTPPATAPLSGGLFTHIERSPGPTRRASIVRAPGAPALPNALALSRALRPLLKKKISRDGIIDPFEH